MTDQEIQQLEVYIMALEKKVDELEKLLDWKNKTIEDLWAYSRELESKVYGGPTK
jgi:wobble nucleotide-excising tRNase